MAPHVPRGIDHGAMTRSARRLMCALGLAAALALPLGAAAEAPPGDASWLYDPMQVTEIDLETGEAALAQLGVRPDEYVEARVTIRNGGSSYGPYVVGLKLKGHGTFRTLDRKAALKIKFGFAVSGQRFQGVKTLTLNNMTQDPSMIAEASSSLVLRAIGVPTARIGYAYVRLNGAEYGLYADVETVDSVMAKRWFASTRHVFEGQLGVDVGPGREAELEVDEGPAADLSDVVALAAADAGGADGWWERMQPVADMAEVVRAFAGEHYIAHWDGYSVAGGELQPDNYYLHSDAAGRFSLIVSGVDTTWEDRSPFGVYAKGALMRHCAADAACRRVYVDTMREIATSPAVAAVAAQARTIREAIAPWRARDPRREQTVADGEVSAAAKIALIEARQTELALWLEHPSFVDAMATAAPAGDPMVDVPATGTPPPVAQAPAVAVPVIAAPRATRVRAGKPMTVTFAVTRSDGGARLTDGKMTCVPSIRGVTLRHTDGFANGKATLRLTVPRTAKGKLLQVRVAIVYDGRSATRTASWRVL